MAVTEGRLGDAAEQSGHLAPRAALREVLEQLPAGVHQRDHDPGQRLADRKRAGHRQRGDDVEADAALLELGDDFEQQRRKDQKGSPAPDPGRQIGLIGKPHCRAEQQGCAGDSGKSTAQNGCDPVIHEQRQP